jgi:hypothetical protein
MTHTTDAVLCVYFYVTIAKVAAEAQAAATATAATTAAAATTGLIIAASTSTAATATAQAPASAASAVAATGVSPMAQQRAATVILNAMYKGINFDERTRASPGFKAAHTAMAVQSQLTLLVVQQICQLYIAPYITAESLQIGLFNIQQAWPGTTAAAATMQARLLAAKQQSDAQPLAYLPNTAAITTPLVQHGRGASSSSRLAALERLLLTDDDDNDDAQDATIDTAEGKQLHTM